MALKITQGTYKLMFMFVSQYIKVILEFKILTVAVASERHYFMFLRTRPVMDLMCSPSASQYTPVGLAQFPLLCFKPDPPPSPPTHPIPPTDTHKDMHTEPPDRMPSSLNNSFFNICPEAALLPFVHSLYPKACHPALIKQKMVINISFC